MVRIQFSRTWKPRFAQNLVEYDHDIRLLRKVPTQAALAGPAQIRRRAGRALAWQHMARA
jgi:hypothetical protein